MGKPKHWWYGTVKNQIKNSKTHPSQESKQMKNIHAAIKKADRYFLKQDEGEIKLYAIHSILIDQTKTYDGLALELNYDRSVIQRWVSKYIYVVGIKAGY